MRKSYNRMPLIQSNYTPPLRIFRNGDIATIYAAMCRKVTIIQQTRERIDLVDGDFIDLDWSYSFKKSNQLVIICHGLEGHAQRPYIMGAAKLFNQHGYDCCAINYRGCSGEINKKFTAYHSGKTEDLQSVIEYILNKNQYQKIILNGFSLGGNLILKYIGEKQKLPLEIKGAIAISTPVDLEGCMVELLKKRNLLYHKNFLKTLKVKLSEKRAIFPDEISDEEFNNIETLKEYDDLYTAKFNGFEGADDYYRKCSALQHLPEIELPTLILNAENDSFLSSTCYPQNIALKSQHLNLEISRYGGHVGFIDKANIYYNEKRTLQFMKEKII